MKWLILEQHCNLGKIGIRVDKITTLWDTKESDYPTGIQYETDSHGNHAVGFSTYTIEIVIAMLNGATDVR